VAFIPKIQTKLEEFCSTGFNFVNGLCKALFFMLISLSGRWKLPIAYVLQNKISATAQAEILKSILKLSYHSSLTI